MKSIIKEQTDDLHTELESSPFNQKMYRSEQTVTERIGYLTSLWMIYNVLDDFVPDKIKRLSKVEKDLEILQGGNFKLSEKIPFAAMGYSVYLEGVAEDIFPHVYLNYMGLMYGGQIMKKRYPDFPTNVYDFDDLEESKKYIRNEVIQETPEFIKETRTGFKWNIIIAHELGQDHEVPYLNLG